MADCPGEFVEAIAQEMQRLLTKNPFYRSP